MTLLQKDFIEREELFMIEVTINCAVFRFLFNSSLRNLFIAPIIHICVCVCVCERMKRKVLKKLRLSEILRGRIKEINFDCVSVRVSYVIENIIFPLLAYYVTQHHHLWRWISQKKGSIIAQDSKYSSQTVCLCLRFS